MRNHHSLLHKMLHVMHPARCLAEALKMAAIRIICSCSPLDYELLKDRGAFLVSSLAGA